MKRNQKQTTAKNIGLEAKKKMMKSDNLTKDEVEPVNEHSHLLNGNNDK